MEYFKFFTGMLAFSFFIFSLYILLWTGCALIDVCAAQNGMLPL